MVATEGEAEVTVEVLGRGPVPAGQVAIAIPMYGGGAIAMSRARNVRVLRTRLRVRGTDYAIDFTGSSGRTWAGAADEIAKQVGSWLGDNRDRLRARR